MHSNPTNYAEWRDRAIESDVRTGADRWKTEDKSGLFDYRVIRGRLDELVAVRASGDSRRLLYYFDEGMHGNMGGMGSPQLYRNVAFGTKHLISDYIGELAAGLEQLAEAPDLELREKLDFFRRAKHAYGNCALMLSGAGSLGPFHLGVARALLSENLLPRIIAGSSAGALIAAILCTHDDDELVTKLSDAGLTDTFEEIRAKTKGTGKRVNEAYVRHMVETWIPDLTFGEALEKTGRHLNVPVAPSELHQQSRKLNESTARNVLIREAVQASCAVPGVLPPVKLAARGPDGKRTAYVQSRSWVDGSMTDDLPASRLSRIYGCNFFITSQSNPLVLWALNDPHSANPFLQMVNVHQSALKEWYRGIYPIAMRTVRHLYPANVLTRMWFSVLTQDYTADVNIMPVRLLGVPGRLLAQPSVTESAALVRAGERKTWPHIERIRNCTRLGSKLHEIVVSLEAHAL